PGLRRCAGRRRRGRRRRRPPGCRRPGGRHPDHPGRQAPPPRRSAGRAAHRGPLRRHAARAAGHARPGGHRDRGGRCLGGPRPARRRRRGPAADPARGLREPHPGPRREPLRRAAAAHRPGPRGRRGCPGAGAARPHHRGGRRHRAEHRRGADRRAAPHGPGDPPGHPCAGAAAGGRQGGLPAGGRDGRRGPAQRADGTRGVPGGGAAMSEIDWKRPLEQVLGDDATAHRQLAEHAQLLPIADAPTAVRFMLARLREHWVSTLLTLVITIGGAVAAAILPRLIGSAVDVVASGGSGDRIWVLGGQILGVGALQAVLTALGWSMISALGQRILAGMREDVIDRALDLPAQTMESSGIGDALSRVADDVDVAARAVNNLVGMATLSPWLLLMVMIIVPMYVVAAVWYLRRTAPIYRRERIAMGARAQGLLSAIHGIPTVHAYGIERRETRHVAVLSETAAV